MGARWSPAGRCYGHRQTVTNVHIPRRHLACVRTVHCFAWSGRHMILNPFSLRLPHPRRSALRAHASLAAPRLDAAFRQLGREHREVSAGIGAGGDGPDGAEVAAVGVAEVPSGSAHHIAAGLVSSWASRLVLSRIPTDN